MDDVGIPSRLCSSGVMVEQLGTAQAAMVLDSNFVHEIPELEDWASHWQLNGPYISGNTSSEVSLIQDVPSLCPTSPVGSNSSWTDEDDTGSLFFDIEQRLRSFVLAEDQTQLTIPPLNSQQRRVVHGIAHLMHLGHQSIKDEGKLCRMLIFKKNSSAAKLSSLPHGIVSDGLSSDKSDYLNLPSLESTQSLPARLPGSGRLARRFEYRLRIPKRESAFPCRFSDCFKMFDRSCDRTKHEKRHGPKDSHPYRCAFEACDKTFMYPKDLRRHRKVHMRRAGRSVAVDESPIDEVFSDASVSSCSESPSLTMSSTSANSTSSLYLERSVSDEDRTPMPKYCQPWFGVESMKGQALVNGDNWVLDPMLRDYTFDHDVH